MKTINCGKCQRPAFCCQTGAWIDLEEAKKILPLKLKGTFFQLEEDKDYPSGYRIGTSFKYNPCTFLESDGLCSIHKIDYKLKPQSCKDFPLEKGKVAPFANELCLVHMQQLKKKSKNKRR